MEKKKLELELNKKITLVMLADKPIMGESKWGPYYLYFVKNGTDQDYSFFAPAEVDKIIRPLKKGDKFELTKIAKQNGSKINISYDVKIIKDATSPEIVNQEQAENGKTIDEGVIEQKNDDNFFQLMLQSCREAVKIQNELGGMMDAKSLAVSLFIARSRS